MKKKMLLPAIAAVVLSLGALGVGQIYAQDTTDHHANLIQQLAQKLGVSEDKVKTAFDEIHSDKHAQMQSQMEQRLSQAVTDGKITEAQKQAILVKFAEMKNNMPVKIDGFKNMSQEQRRQAMESKHTELESWAQQNGISLETLRELMPHHKARHIMKAF
jgi:hypothetical protein